MVKEKTQTEEMKSSEDRDLYLVELRILIDDLEIRPLVITADREATHNRYSLWTQEPRGFPDKGVSETEGNLDRYIAGAKSDITHRNWQISDDLRYLGAKNIKEVWGRSIPSGLPIIRYIAHIE